MRSFLVLGAVFLSLSLAASPELSFDFINKNAKEVLTIDELLGRFSKSTLERHLLVYGSESQQFASFLSPRVLVYTPSADFVMTFNGEPSSEGYYDLEMLHFDRRDWKFHPEVIHFDPTGRTAPQIDEHPTICANCHQNDIRPNWDGYFHWVGFYGSEDDNVNAGAPNIDDKLTTGPEAEWYKKFLAKKQAQVEAKAGRYRFLPERHYVARPNEDFNDQITRLNMRRLLRVISEHPQAGKIFEHLDFGMPKIDELPAELTRHAKRTYQQVYDDTKRIFLKARKERVARHTKLTGAPPQGRARLMADDSYWQQSLENELKFAASWRWVFEEVFNESFQPMSTARHKDYRLNLVGLSSFLPLVNETRLDRWTGKLILPMDRD